MENLNETRPQPPQSISRTSFVGPDEDNWTLVTPVPQLKCRCYTPKSVNPILTEQDIQETQNNIEELMYQMETLGERSLWNFNWKMDYHLPGYRECSPTRLKAAESQPALSIKKKLRKEDVFTRLYAPRRRIPSPCHSTCCNAHKLGIANKIHKERITCSSSKISDNTKPRKTATAKA